jgi:hypothetical protein
VSDDKLMIDPESLAVARGEAQQMAAELPGALVTPPAKVASPIDGALVELAEAIRTKVTAAEAADAAVADEQAAMLAESPPVLVQQDQQGAQVMTEAGAGISAIQFPTPSWNV